MRLRTKLAFGLVVLTLLLSLGTYGGLELYKSQQVDHARSHVTQTADIAAAQLRSEVDSHREDLAFTAGRVDGSNLSAAGAVVGPYIRQSRFFAAYVVDREAVIVEAVGPFNDSERAALVGTHTDIGCVNETLATGEGCVSPIQGPTDPPYVVMTAPVFDDEGQVAGVLAAPIYVDAEGFFSPLSTLDTADQSVRVFHDGRVLYAAGQAFDDRVVATRPVSGLDLTVRVEQNNAALTAELRTLAVAQGVGILLVMFVVLLLGYWEYSVNLSQTERLLDGFDAIEAGAYDHDPGLGASEEWQQINAGFTDLASSLAAREAALKEREQRLAVLNRVIRHNVRNEMNVVLSYTEMLAERLSGEDAAQAATAAQAGGRLTALAEKAREVEKILSRGGAEPGPVELVGLVRAAGEEVAATHPDVTFRTELPERCWVHGVEELREAVAELLTNACTHTDAAEPRVTVSLQRTDADGDDDAKGRTVRLRVADNGPGIPEHEWRAIERGGETALEHASGLGLWLVYWVVDRCDGTLSFEDDDGAVVECTFRAASPPGEREAGTGAD